MVILAVIQTEKNNVRTNPGPQDGRVTQTKCYDKTELVGFNVVQYPGWPLGGGEKLTDSLEQQPDRQISLTPIKKQ